MPFVWGLTFQMNSLLKSTRQYPGADFPLQWDHDYAYEFLIKKVVMSYKTVIQKQVIIVISEDKGGAQSQACAWVVVSTWSPCRFNKELDEDDASSQFGIRLTLLLFSVITVFIWCVPSGL